MVRSKLAEAPINPIRNLGKRFFKRSLRSTGPTRTFPRLCTSAHLGDLQWIAFFVCVGWSIGIVPILLFTPPFAPEEIKQNCPNVIGHWPMLGHESLVSIGALTAIAGAALNWTYQTGSKRLGAVDLFACEISAICRVSLVVDFARTCIWTVDPDDPIVKMDYKHYFKATSDHLNNLNSRGPSEDERKFTSEEHYTPVYDGSLSDLQPLDADVVNRVTEFYTYRKAMMDYMRKIAVPHVENDELATLRVQMMYMQFLMYESARLAINSLIEFEPNWSESVLNIFCSEIVLHGYLLRKYCASYGPKDYRVVRLKLRSEDYECEIPETVENARRAARTERYNNGDLEPNKRLALWARSEVIAEELARRSGLSAD